MTSGIPSFLSTVPDRALPAVHENIIGQTAVATDVIYCQIFTVGQLAFARDLALVDAQESLLEFLILIPVGDVHGAYAAVQSAGGYKIGIDIHIFLSFVFIVYIFDQSLFLHQFLPSTEISSPDWSRIPEQRSFCHCPQTKKNAVWSTVTSTRLPFHHRPAHEQNTYPSTKHGGVKIPSPDSKVSSGRIDNPFPIEADVNDQKK
jgi:hypothetical protein